MKTEKKYWLDNPKNIKKLIIGVVIICAGLLISEFFYEKHGHFAVEHWFGFYGFYGFIVFIGIVLLGKELRKVLMRKEDYYDE